MKNKKLVEIVKDEIKDIDKYFAEKRPSNQYLEVMNWELIGERDNAIFDAGMKTAYSNVLRWIEQIEKNIL